MRAWSDVLVGVGRDQAGIDRKAFAADQTFVDAASHDRLEQAPQEIALAEAAVPVLREGRVVGHIAVQPEPTEPAIGQIEMHFLTQPPLRADAKAVADDQHPDHQLGIDRGPSDRAVERPQLCTDALQINKPINAAKQMIPWHMIVEAEIVEQLRRRDLYAHHQLSLLVPNN